MVGLFVLVLVLVLFSIWKHPIFTNSSFPRPAGPTSKDINTFEGSRTRIYNYARINTRTLMILIRDPCKNDSTTVLV